MISEWFHDFKMHVRYVSRGQPWTIVDSWDSLRSSKSEEAESPNWVQLRRLRSQAAHELHLSEWRRWPDWTHPQGTVPVNGLRLNYDVMSHCGKTLWQCGDITWYIPTALLPSCPATLPVFWICASLCFWWNETASQSKYYFWSCDLYTITFFDVWDQI